MPKVTLELGCGETTCINMQTHKPCRFLMTVRFGTTYVCGLIRDDNPGKYFSEKVLEEDRPGGCLLRCPECLALERES